MNEFKSVFKNELTEYLAISQGTISDGTLQNTRRILLSFDSLLAEENAGGISEKTVIVGLADFSRLTHLKQSATR